MEKESYMKCLFCGGELAWDAEFNANETHYDYDVEDAAVCSCYHCARCGRSYEILDPPTEEREGEYSDYWSNK